MATPGIGPFPGFGPLLGLDLALNIISFGLERAMYLARDKADDFIINARKHIFSPLLLANDVVVLLTGWVGVFITLPLLGMQGVFYEFFAAYGLHNRLIRVDDAVDGFWETMIQAVKFSTNTGEDTFTRLVLTWAATTTWHFIKDVQFLIKLMNVKSEFEMIDLFLVKGLSRLRFVGAVGAIIALVFSVLNIAIVLCMIMFAFNIVTFVKLILPQNSKRISFRGNFRKRIRVGKPVNNL